MTTRVFCLKEVGELETRVAIVPETVSKYIKLGLEVGIESGAGERAGFSDEIYQQAGAKVVGSREDYDADGLLCVETPTQLDNISSSTFLLGLLSSPHSLTCQSFSLSKLPRITRAQSMDALSSQANIAGYKAVIDAVGLFHRVVPMLMTAAGMIKPAKVLILGAGVAGLQAIATAKRLGARVYAFDVRSSVREQVESLGGEFVEVAKSNSKDDGVYAEEMGEGYKKKQAELIHKFAVNSDIVISTALIPNKQAPKLLKKRTVKEMRRGAVIVDLATSMGGNCELGVPNGVIEYKGVTILGAEHLARNLPETASMLYANNCFSFINLLYDKEQKKLTMQSGDDILQATLIGGDNG